MDVTTEKSPTVRDSFQCKYQSFNFRFSFVIRLDLIAKLQRLDMPLNLFLTASLIGRSLSSPCCLSSPSAPYSRRFKAARNPSICGRIRGRCIGSKSRAALISGVSTDISLHWLTASSMMLRFSKIDHDNGKNQLARRLPSASRASSLHVDLLLWMKHFFEV